MTLRIGYSTGNWFEDGTPEWWDYNVCEITGIVSFKKALKRIPDEHWDDITIMDEDDNVLDVSEAWDLAYEEGKRRRGRHRKNDK